MTGDQIAIIAILALAMAAFLSGRLRHDMVAMGALIACVAAGLVPSEEAFAGFGHPAVITVACVLVLSRGLQTSGAVDVLARTVLPDNAGRTLSLAALTGLGAALSGFMNNVGAMALLMPVALQLARRLDMTPGRMLMPLAFGTILGGMTTLIGTPPNLIVSGFRASAGGGGGSFSMFDFAPVGLAVALAGLAFIVTIGWRLVPITRAAAGEAFEVGSYLTEVRVEEKGKADGMNLYEIEAELDKAAAQVVGMVRGGLRVSAPRGNRRVQGGDVLVLEADVEGIAEALSKLDLTLEEQAKARDEEREEKERVREEEARREEDEQRRREIDEAASLGDVALEPEPEPAEPESPADGEGDAEKGEAGEAADADAREVRRDTEAEEVVLRELVVRPEAQLVGRSARDLALRSRFGVNLLGVSRNGRRSTTRLRTLQLQSGDLLLMQGPADVLAEFAAETGCVPLAERELRIPDKRKALLAAGILGLSILVTVIGLLPAAVSFAAGVLASMLLRTVPLRSVYTAVDWPVVVLLAALIPVAGAMEATGTAELIATFLVGTLAQGHPVAALAMVLVVTMFLSDVMNNAATAAVMCPIAIGIAATLGVNPDAFLMAVAIGASCAFLTPIGHQNNTLILGPGGFGFGDYWRLGLPLELVVAAVAVPMLLLVWPL
ncbi:SLC13 family permease [Stappia indica]|uniref:TrkA-C domain-containing protein n=1 Tax=Stappia indica TaxID=538381 RepID=A0A285TBJ4_9HYPH|nr:SLC13 family permease [Stappia indica]SOC19428.1 TrkA-C domain-containing protein [Stappia indica]